MNCEKCNAELAKNASFCHVCGARVLTEHDNNNNTKNSKTVGIYTVLSLTLYGIALIVCLICNFAIDRTLSWFYIVLVSILLSFSITNLPLMVKKHRLIISAICVTLMVYPLLFVCWNYTGGDWLFTFAYPVATFSLLFAWLMLLTGKYLKANWGYKISIILILSSILTITSNPFIEYLLGNKYNLISSFVYDGGAVDNSANGIVFIAMLACALISFIVGVFITIKKRRQSK